MGQKADEDLPGHVTHLLQKWHEGSDAAASDLFALIDQEIHEIAQKRMVGERNEHTLQASDLVNEAVQRLLPRGVPALAHRAQFFHLISKAMRNILIDHARQRNADKRGGGARKLGLTGHDIEAPEESVDLMFVHAALQELEKVDARQAKIIQMKFFAGMNNQDAADALGISLATLKREWASARDWLKGKLGPDG
jgi:RNA polymerase sigma factor (TIGR02999 family)